MRLMIVTVTDSQGVLLDQIRIKVPETVRGFGLHLIGPDHGDDPMAEAELAIGAPSTGPTLQESR